MCVYVCVCVCVCVRACECVCGVSSVQSVKSLTHSRHNERVVFLPFAHAVSYTVVWRRSEDGTGQLESDNGGKILARDAVAF